MTTIDDARACERAREPKKCLHRQSGRAYVRLDGKQVMLGDHANASTEALYQHLLDHWRERDGDLPPDEARRIIARWHADGGKVPTRQERTVQVLQDVAGLLAQADPQARAVAGLLRERFDPEKRERYLVRDLVADYLVHCETYYRHPDGTVTSEVASSRYSMRDLLAMFGERDVDTFGAQELHDVREAMVKQGFTTKCRRRSESA